MAESLFISIAGTNGTLSGRLLVLLWGWTADATVGRQQSALHKS